HRCSCCGGEHAKRTGHVLHGGSLPTKEHFIQESVSRKRPKSQNSITTIVRSYSSRSRMSSVRLSASGPTTTWMTFPETSTPCAPADRSASSCTGPGSATTTRNRVMQASISSMLSAPPSPATIASALSAVCPPCSARDVLRVRHPGSCSSIISGLAPGCLSSRLCAREVQPNRTSHIVLREITRTVARPSETLTKHSPEPVRRTVWRNVSCSGGLGHLVESSGNVGIMAQAAGEALGEQLRGHDQVHG